MEFLVFDTMHELRRKYLVLLLPFLAIIIISCQRQYYFSAKSTDLSNESINGIVLGQSINEEPFVKIYAKTKLFSVEKYQYTYYALGNGLKIAVDSQGNIVRIIATSLSKKEITTSRGLKIGDSKKSIIKAYGTAFYERPEEGLRQRIIGYVDHKTKATIEFCFDDNKTVEIRLDSASVR